MFEGVKNSIGNTKYNIVKYISMFIIGTIVFSLLNPFVVIGTGERGIVYSKFQGGIQQNELGEGLHFRIPFVENINIMNVQTEKMIFSNKPQLKEGEIAIIYPRLDSASKKLQDVYVDAIITYHVNPDKASELYQEVGRSYATKKVQPPILDIIKAATGKFEVKEILNNRDVITKQVTDRLRKELEKDNIILERVSLSNFDFDSDYKKSIEEKQIAEVHKGKEQILLETVTIKAQQKVEQAKADKDAAIAIAEGRKQAKILEGEGIKAYNESIKLELNPSVLKYKALENAGKAIDKWKGLYPTTYMGGTSGPIPLVNIK